MATPRLVFLGTSPNDGTGDHLHTAFNKINENATDLYASGPVGSNITIQGNEINTLSGGVNITKDTNITGTLLVSGNVSSATEPTMPSHLVTLQYLETHGTDAPVESVNGKIGAVILNATDVGALEAFNQIVPSVTTFQQDIIANSNINVGGFIVTTGTISAADPVALSNVINMGYLEDYNLYGGDF